MCSKGVPKQLWDYVPVWVSKISNRTARGPDAEPPWMKSLATPWISWSGWILIFMIGAGTGKDLHMT